MPKKLNPSEEARRLPIYDATGKKIAVDIVGDAVYEQDGVLFDTEGFEVDKTTGKRLK